jgi:hypothetical protein
MLIVAGCASSATRESNTMKDGFEALMERPDLTAIQADYQWMLQTIRQRLVAEVGVAAWLAVPEPISGTFCAGQLVNLDEAVERSIDAGFSVGNLPDAKWDQAVAIVTEVGKQHGFGEPKVIVDGPSNHEVTFRGNYQGNLVFGTGGGTILTVRTGCHLTQEAHQRGTYLPPEQYRGSTRPRGQ